MASYDKTLALKPDSAEAFNNRGAALQELKRFGEALASFDRALEFRPDYAGAFNNRGNALEALGRYDEALASYDRALALEPDYADAANNRGVVLAALRRYDEALASYDRALALKPDYANPFNGRGVALMALRRFEEALASYDQALALKPDYADAFSNRGNVLRVRKRFDEAVASYDKAVALRPDHAEAFNNRGVALQELRRFDEALASYQHAQALNPDYAEAHWNEGLLRLLTGDFDRGWIKSEWRWKLGSLASSKRSFAQPLWRGDETLERKTILLHSEQGLGDSIQFCRYAPLVAARGARVILQVDEPLRQIVSGVAGGLALHLQGGGAAGFRPALPAAQPAAGVRHTARVDSVRDALSPRSGADEGLGGSAGAETSPQNRPRVVGKPATRKRPQSIHQARSDVAALRRRGDVREPAERRARG